jgi:hypothetical protein
VSPVKYELGFYILEDGIVHTHRRDSLRSYLDHLISEVRIMVEICASSPNYEMKTVSLHVPHVRFLSTYDMLHAKCDVKVVFPKNV